MVRAVRYITERLPVLIQAVRFCPSGESARTLFKSSESNPTLSNKQNSPYAQYLREAQPLLHPVCVNESFFTFAQQLFTIPDAVRDHGVSIPELNMSTNSL